MIIRIGDTYLREVGSAGHLTMASGFLLIFMASSGEMMNRSSVNERRDARVMN